MKISVGSYEKNLDMVDDRTFVYFDPPYRPLPGSASFKDYHKADFGDEQSYWQKNASNSGEKHPGVKIMISNSDPTQIDPSDNFSARIIPRDVEVRFSFLNKVSANRASIL